MKTNRLTLGACLSLVLFTTGCLSDIGTAIGEALGEAIGEGIVCGVASAFPSDGISHPGEEDSYYVLKDDSKSRTLMNGTSGEVQFFDFKTLESVDVEDETVLELSKFHVDDDRCGIMAHLETHGVGTTAVTFEDKSGNTHTWQVDVAEVVPPPRISSSSFGTLEAGQTLELSKDDSVDIEIEVVDTSGDPLAFLEPAYWSITGAEGIVELTARLDDDNPADSSSMPATSRVNVLASETGETEILVKSDGFEARFPILVSSE